MAAVDNALTRVAPLVEAIEESSASRGIPSRMPFHDPQVTRPDAEAFATGRPRRYVPLRAYAAIGDCHGSALVASDGGVDWCCLHRFDAQPVLARILDASR